MGISLLLGCIPFYFLTNYVDKDASVSAPVLVYPGSRLVLLSCMMLHDVSLCRLLRWLA